MSSCKDAKQSGTGTIWLLVTLATGALLGIALAAYFTGREHPQPDDPDAPLFI